MNRWIAIIALWSLPASGQVPIDVVPTADVAIQIARAVLTPIYGAETISHEEPLIAELHGDQWEVTGTFNCHGCAGGVLEISIEKKDGRVTRISHGR